MQKLSSFEAAVLEWIAASSGDAALRAQLARAKVSERKYTVVGCYSTLWIPADSPRSSEPYSNHGPLDGPCFEGQGVEHGGGTLLWFAAGHAECLEIYAYGPYFPADHTELGDFRLFPAPLPMDWSDVPRTGTPDESSSSKASRGNTWLNSRNSAVGVKQQVWIHASPKTVWDFTQDYSLRPAWDRSILWARVLAESPERRVEIAGAGGLKCVFRYRQFDPPHRTSLGMIEVRSPLFVSGGGSWSYEPDRDGTRWEVTNALVFRNRWMFMLLGWFVAWQLDRSTRKALAAAKSMIERQR